MPARPLHCIYCRGVFMPASKHTWSAVQCPHCSGQMKVGECEAAPEPPVGVPQPYVRVTEEEEQKVRENWKYHRWTGRLVVLGFAGLVLAAAALATVMWEDGPVRRTDRSDGQDSEELRKLEVKRAEERWPGAPALAERFLTVSQWHDLPPLSADAARVEGVMTWYYGRREFRAATGPVKLLQFQDTEAEGRQLLRVEAEISEGHRVWLLLVQENGAWKVDWEVFVNANTLRWEAFLREPAGTEIELPLLASLKPIAVNYTVKAGVSPDSHAAIKLWATELKSVAGAVLPKEALKSNELQGMGYNDAVKIIARVAMENPALDPPLVKLEKIVQRGWVRAR